MDILNKIFKLNENNTTVKIEVLSGITAFLTMSYLFILSPKFLEIMGINFTVSITITSVVIFIGCVLMSFAANKPYVTAPFIAESAFAAYTVVSALGFSYKTVITSFFLTGVILFLLTVFNVRTFIISCIPKSIQTAFCTGLGLYFIYISLKTLGFLSLLGLESAGISLKNIQLHCILGIICLILTILFSKKGYKSAIILSVFIVTLIGVLISDVKLPLKLMSVPQNITDYIFPFDFNGILSKNYIAVFIVIFIVANIDTAGSLLSLRYREKALNSCDDVCIDYKTLKKPMIADSLSTVIASVFGTTTTGAFADSAVGINMGAKTGLSTLVAGILFFFGMFFSPLISVIPVYAYAPILLYVGILLTQNIMHAQFDDISEFSVTAVTIGLMIFTQNIGFGIMAGFFLYPLLKILCLKKDKINITHWILFIISLIFFIIYPYGL